MGGFGSGKWADINLRKMPVEICNELSVKILAENGFIDKNRAGVIEWENVAGEITSRLEIESSATVDNKKIFVIRNAESNHEQRIELIEWPCNYGGVRYYFACPAVKDGSYCGNRVTKLFLPPRGKVFGCRECYDLTYQSCQESHKYDKVFGHIENSDINSLSVNQALRLGGL